MKQAIFFFSNVYYEKNHFGFKKNCWYQRISIGMDLLQNQIKLHEPLLFCLDLHVRMMEVVVLEIEKINMFYEFFNIH